MALTPKPIDLCLAADVKVEALIASADVSADNIISRRITSVSRAIMSWLNIPLIAMVYTEVRNGNGHETMSFLNGPCFAVNSLTIDTIAVSAAADALSSGYSFNADSISVRGWPATGASSAATFGPYRFNRGRQNVIIQNASGYALPNQTANDWVATTAYLYGATIKPTTNNAGGFIFVATNPASGTSGGTRPTVFNQTPGAATTDGGVTWANLGVTALPAPLPEDISEACIDLVNLRIKERTRVGEMSAVTPGGLSVSYFRGNFPPSVQETLQQYKNVLPVEL